MTDSITKQEVPKQSTPIITRIHNHLQIIYMHAVTWVLPLQNEHSFSQDFPIYTLDIITGGCNKSKLQHALKIIFKGQVEM